MLLGHIGDNNSVYECAFWYDESYPEVFYDPNYGRWYRSKDKRGGLSPFTSYMMNKKWTLEEEFNNHMMRFQQVTVSFIYLISKLDFAHYNLKSRSQYVTSHRWSIIGLCD